MEHDRVPIGVVERDDVADLGVARRDPVEPDDVAGAKQRPHRVGELDMRRDSGRGGSRDGQDADGEEKQEHGDEA
jgi:hypothetical protein